MGIYKNADLNKIADSDPRLAAMLRSLEEANERLITFIAKGYIAVALDEMKFIYLRSAALRGILNEMPNQNGATK